MYFLFGYLDATIELNFMKIVRADFEQNIISNLQSNGNKNVHSWHNFFYSKYR